QGMRVLGVAQAEVAGSSEHPERWPFVFLGLVAFADPLRAEVPAALAEATRAGIRVVMMTGDYPATAATVARQAGINVSAGVLTGREVAELSFEALSRRLEQVRVFARIFPEQKLRIVEALKADGEVVAMTGDGVNDAPALEAAHIGMAMGRRGADVAREASDLVLLDDSFSSIIGGVRLGRRIFANLRRALTYVTAIHVPIAGLALAPILLGMPPLLLPMHVVLLELVIDPTCALVFEVEPSDERAMQRPPRPRDQPLFGPLQIAFAALQGSIILVAVLAVYALGLQRSAEATMARGGAFIALIVSLLCLGLANSMSSSGLFAPHRAIYWAIAGVVAVILTAVFAVPALAAIFEVSSPGLLVLAVAIAAGVAVGSWPVLRLSISAPATAWPFRRRERQPRSAIWPQRPPAKLRPPTL
ncbi:MAG TPA: cation-translocating P-type ATPase, partial [Caulobacteraceae bacterium]|nr:cation-translocating P-type ATPase [Caulobacteraceae bacterium]